MNNLFKEFWNEYTKENPVPNGMVDRDLTQAAAKEAWNRALDHARRELPNLGEYKYAANVQDKFTKNIDQLYV